MRLPHKICRGRRPRRPAQHVGIMEHSSIVMPLPNTAGTTCGLPPSPVPSSSKTISLEILRFAANPQKLDFARFGEPQSLENDNEGNRRGEGSRAVCCDAVTTSKLNNKGNIIPSWSDIALFYLDLKIIFCHYFYVVFRMCAIIIPNNSVIFLRKASG